MQLNNLLDILPATFRMSIPLVLAALGGVISERSGVVNIALEGLMLIGAFFAVVGSYFTGSPWLGLLFALLSGIVVAFIHALLSVYYKADQIVSGIAINILAVGATNYCLFLFFNTSGHSPEVSHLPWQLFGYITIILLIIIYVVLYHTPLGLRIRAIGEHPKAADTLGINVQKVRCLCVLASGLLAALGGAYLSLGHLSSFTREMSAGKGFIALAAMIFGKWHPIGAAMACLLFGLTDAIQLHLMGRWNIPPEFLNMLPYIITMILLAGLIGKAKPPAADGIPYDPTDKR